MADQPAQTVRNYRAHRRVLDLLVLAVAVEFHDQAHLHRHVMRLVGITPGRYARSLPARSETNATVHSRAAGDPTAHLSCQPVSRSTARSATPIAALVFAETTGLPIGQIRRVLLAPVDRGRPPP